MIDKLNLLIALGREQRSLAPQRPAGSPSPRASGIQSSEHMREVLLVQLGSLLHGFVFS